MVGHIIWSVVEYGMLWSMVRGKIWHAVECINSTSWNMVCGKIWYVIEYER